MITSRATSRQSASAFHSLLVTFSLFLALTSILLPSNVAYCGQATLAWDPETASGLAGYRVHYGTASGTYTSVADAGLQTTYTVTGLTAGTTYYFAATAYDTSGTESTFSNEAAYTVPSACSYAISPGSASFTASGGTGSIAVTTAGTCSWTATSPASWVTITSGGQRHG